MGTVYGTMFKTGGWHKRLCSSGTSLGPDLSSATLPSNFIKTLGKRGIRLRFYSTAADTSGVGNWGFALYRVDIDHPTGATSNEPKHYISDKILSTTGILAATSGVAGNLLIGVPSGAWTSTEKMCTKAAITLVSTSTHTKTQQYVNGVSASYNGTSGATPAEVWISDLGNAYGLSIAATTYAATSIAGETGVLYHLDT